MCSMVPHIVPTMNFIALEQKHTANKYEIPALVPVEHEQSDVPVLDYYRTQDLIIVPVTQIAPSGLCTPVPDTGVATAASCSTR